MKLPTSSAPRNPYVITDGCWIAISASSTMLAGVMMLLVGRSDLVQQPWFGIGRDRARNADTIDAAVQDWFGKLRYTDAADLLAPAKTPFAPIHDIADLANDPHIVARGGIATITDPELGTVGMQNLPARFFPRKPSCRGQAAPSLPIPRRSLPANAASRPRKLRALGKRGLQAEPKATCGTCRLSLTVDWAASRLTVRSVGFGKRYARR